MNIPKSITNAITSDPASNDYFYGADQMWQRLTEVRQGNVPYLDIDMAMLANCIELYYKGLLVASKVKVPEDVIKRSHSLLRLTEEIESRICPLQYNMSMNDKRGRRNFLIDLSSKYIDCRYNNCQVDRSDFNLCYDWAEKQKQIIFDIIKPVIKESEDMDYDR